MSLGLSFGMQSVYCEGVFADDVAIVCIEKKGRGRELKVLEGSKVYKGL